MKWQQVGLGALLVGLALAGSARGAEKASLTQGNASAKSGYVHIFGGALVLREGQAGGTFSVVRTFGGKGELGYFLVLRHGLSNDTTCESGEKVNSDGTAGEVEQNLAVDGKKLALTYRIEVDGKGRKVRKEGLTLNDKPVDLAKGRVLLVDLTASPVKWEQKKLDLPSDVSPCTERSEAEELVKKTLADLAKQDKATRAFIEGK